MTGIETQSNTKGGLALEALRKGAGEDRMRAGTGEGQKKLGGLGPTEEWMVEDIEAKEIREFTERLKRMRSRTAPKPSKSKGIAVTEGARQEARPRT